MSPRTTHLAATLTFGTLLKQLRKRAGMTQSDLAAALGYSIALISSLEKAQRRPDLTAVMERFIPALGLQGDPRTAATLIELAALARGERLPAAVTLQRTTYLSVQTELQQAQPAGLVEADSSAALPALPTALIGRAAEVTQISNRLLGHGGRLLTLVGPPGVGKTTLALAVAGQVQHHYRDGARFVPLAAVSNIGLMAATLAATLAPGDASAKPPQNRIIELLRRQTLLLLLDNLEQIDGAASLIATLLAECPTLTILATSRERLHLRAEQRFKVPPLPLAAAIELFVQRAQALDGEMELTEENHPTVAAICRRLDCLPLALELCAAQLDLFSPAQLLAQLQARSLDLLVDGAQDLPPQQRTLRHAIGRSYALLQAEERLLFRCLGVFVGEFDLAAVEAVSDWCQEPRAHPLHATVHALINKSLVRTETQVTDTTAIIPQRFRMLETIREFAREQLIANGEAHTAQERHADYYNRMASAANNHTDQHTLDSLFAQLEAAHPNFRAALRWLIDQQSSDCLRMASSLKFFWFTQGHISEGRNWLLAVLKAVPEMTVDSARAWLDLANLAQIQDDIDAAEAYANQAGQIYQALNDSDGIVYASSTLGWIKHGAQRYQEAEEIFGVGLRSLEPTGNQLLIARFRFFIAHMQRDQGIYTDDLHREITDLFIQQIALDDIWGAAHTGTLLVRFDLERADYAQIGQVAKQTIELARQTQDKQVIAWTETYCGESARIFGDLEQALVHLGRAQQCFTDIGSRSGMAEVAYYYGRTAEHQLQMSEAQSYYQQALALATELKLQPIQIRCVMGLLRLARAQKLGVKATEWLAKLETLIGTLSTALPPADRMAYEKLLVHSETVGQ
ncbi:MAG: helix-turn-helix domain-containing protein [Caldilineaceae bacterium]